jgi:hypothetical protein
MSRSAKVGMLLSACAAWGGGMGTAVCSTTVVSVRNGAGQLARDWRPFQVVFMLGSGTEERRDCLL